MQILRPKGYLGNTGHLVALLLVGVPLIMLTARLLALPGARLGDLPVLSHLAAFGDWLDAGFTLGWVPEADRRSVEYLAFLPTAGLLIVLTRLTFGLRILGYRSILIAVGFHEVGILPSAAAMLAVFVVVALLRPGMRQVRLPLYARVSLIISITACILVACLFVGMWQRSPLVWSLAFFPVIILAMMAEAIAGSMDTQTVGTAAWRLLWTLVLALVLLALMTSPAATLLLLAPELMLMQLGLIVLLSEYLDLRLLQDWKLQGAELLHRMVPTWSAEEIRRPRVAVVHNRGASGTVGRLGPPVSEAVRSTSSQHLIDGLRTLGFNVKVFEADMRMLREVGKFLPPHPRSGAPGGVVLNLSEGIQGHDPHSHAPAMLEMAGLAYTGPTPAGQVALDDPVLLRLKLEQAGVPVTHGEARGREVHVGILGDTHLRAFPPALAKPNGTFQCPAQISAEDADQARDCAFRAFRAAGCRDFAVVRVLFLADGSAQVAGVAAHGVLGRQSSTAVMLRAVGLSWGELAREIVECAGRRTGVDWVQRAHEADPDEDMAPLAEPPRAQKALEHAA